MDEEEFYSWLESLDPQMQQEALYAFGMQGANQVPGMFAGGSSPELDYGSYDLGGYNQLPPAYDKKGNVLPWGLDQEAKASNIMQDLGAMTVDNALAMYGGAGSYDPQAFEDVVTPVGQPLDMSGSNYLSTLAQGGGYESFLAQHVQAGFSPSEAATELVKFLSSPGEDEVDPKKAMAREAMRLTMPRAGASSDPFAEFMAGGAGATGAAATGEIDWSTPQSIAASIDLGKITKTAEDLFERQANIPQAGYQDPNTGLLYAASESEPSAIKQKFNAAGMPDPFETYWDEDWLNAPVNPEEAAAREKRTGEAKTAWETAGTNVTGAKSQLDDMTKQYQQYMAEQGAAKGPGLKPPQYKIGADTGQITEAKDVSGEKESRFKYADLSQPLLQRANENWGKARTARDEAMTARSRAFQKTTPAEENRAGAIMRAYQMEKQGRTPMNDLLMQRAMARRMLMGQ